MGSVNANFYPASPGLTLGNANQRWTAYLQDAFTVTLQSASALPALSGMLRLSSTDKIAWRNAANTGDVQLGSTGAQANNVPADSLSFNGGGIEGTFISETINPATAGALRLAANDTIRFRNAANGADVVALIKNADDTVTVGGAGGQKQSIILSSSANPAASGILRLANGDLVSWRNAANSGDDGLSFDSADALLVTSPTPRIRFGGSSASFPMLKATGTIISATLADDSADAQFNCSGLVVGAAGLVSYKGRSPQGEGMPILVGVIDLAAQTSAIAASDLVGGGIGAGQSGTYRISWYAKVTTAAGTSSTLGPLTVTFTDPDSVAQSVAASAVISAGTIATTSTGNTTTTLLTGVPLLFNVKGGTAFQYTFGYASNAANAMNYRLNIRVEFLG